MHELNEPAFVPTLRYLLRPAHEELLPHLERPCSVNSTNGFSSNSVSPQVLALLASGSLYEELVCDRDPVRFLIAEGWLKVRPGLEDRVKEMATDVEPFFESIHFSILEAICAMHTARVSPELIASTLKLKQSPFDLEDALTLWLDGMPPCHVTMTLTQDLLVNKRPARLCAHFGITHDMPWTDHELEGFSGPTKKVIVSALCDLFWAVYVEGAGTPAPVPRANLPALAVAAVPTEPKPQSRRIPARLLKPFRPEQSVGAERDDHVQGGDTMSAACIEETGRIDEEQGGEASLAAPMEETGRDDPEQGGDASPAPTMEAAQLLMKLRDSLTELLGTPSELQVGDPEEDDAEQTVESSVTMRDATQVAAFETAESDLGLHLGCAEIALEEGAEEIERVGEDADETEEGEAELEMEGKDDVEEVEDAERVEATEAVEAFTKADCDSLEAARSDEDDTVHDADEAGFPEEEKAETEKTVAAAPGADLYSAILLPVAPQRCSSALLINTADTGASVANHDDMQGDYNEDTHNDVDEEDNDNSHDDMHGDYCEDAHNDMHRDYSEDAHDDVDDEDNTSSAEEQDAEVLAPHPPPRRFSAPLPVATAAARDVVFAQMPLGAVVGQGSEAFLAVEDQSQAEETQRSREESAASAKPIISETTATTPAAAPLAAFYIAAEKSDDPELLAKRKQMMLRKLSSHDRMHFHAHSEPQLTLPPLLPQLVPIAPGRSRSAQAAPTRRVVAENNPLTSSGGSQKPKTVTATPQSSPVRKTPAGRSLPSLRARPGKASATQALLRNALTHVLLPGPLNKHHLESCLRIVEENADCVVLLRGAQNHAFRGLYALEDAQFFRSLYGSGPACIEVENDLIKHWYKYDSGRKGFLDLPTRGAIGSVCAIVIDSYK